jgi:hypothetical protein
MPFFPVFAAPHPATVCWTAAHRIIRRASWTSFVGSCPSNSFALTLLADAHSLTPSKPPVTRVVGQGAATSPARKIQKHVDQVLFSQSLARYPSRKSFLCITIHPFSCCGCGMIRSPIRETVLRSIATRDLLNIRWRWLFRVGHSAPKSVCANPRTALRCSQFPRAGG